MERAVSGYESCDRTGGSRHLSKAIRFTKRAVAIYGHFSFPSRIARIWWRCKLEKQGYETAYATIAPALGLSRVLDREGRIPSGMVRITGRKIENIQLVDYFLDRYEVTNKQFREFIRAGGYQKQSYWKYEFPEEWQEAYLGRGHVIFYRFNRKTWTCHLASRRLSGRPDPTFRWPASAGTRLPHMRNSSTRACPPYFTGHIPILYPSSGCLSGRAV